ncbi:MAG: hypothetical protein K8H88_17155 [Sandaracinaceae bacterium]|nr:hypothetical protein [Sandaracinaceae bacterium]
MAREVHGRRRGRFGLSELLQEERLDDLALDAMRGSAPALRASSARELDSPFRAERFLHAARALATTAEARQVDEIAAVLAFVARC